MYGFAWFGLNGVGSPIIKRKTGSFVCAFAGLSQRFAFYSLPLFVCDWDCIFSSLSSLILRLALQMAPNAKLLVQYIKASNAFQRLSMTCLS